MYIYHINETILWPIDTIWHLVPLCIITRTNVKKKLQWNLNQNEIIFILKHAFEMSSAKWWPFCSRPNVSTYRCFRTAPFNQKHAIASSNLVDLYCTRLQIYQLSRSKKTSKLCVTGLCVGKSPVTGEFPAQKASNAENVSIWWRHYDGRILVGESGTDWSWAMIGIEWINITQWWSCNNRLSQTSYWGHSPAVDEVHLSGKLWEMELLWKGSRGKKTVYGIMRELPNKLQNWA